MIWWLWKARNALVFESKSWLPEAVAESAKQMALEVMSSSFKRNFVNPVEDVWVRWVPPRQAQHRQVQKIGYGDDDNWWFSERSPRKVDVRVHS